MGYRRALVIRFGGMGDILLSTPSVRALRQNNPNIIIDFIVGKGMEDALIGNTDVDNVIRFDKNGGDAKLLPFVRFLVRIAKTRYDVVLNFHPSIKSGLMCIATLCIKQIYFKKTLLNDPSTHRQVHAIDDFTKELRSLGINCVSDRDMRFDIPSSAHSEIAACLRRAGVPEHNKLLVINPAATRPINRWDKERFADVADYFSSQPGVSVVVTGAPSTFKSFTDDLDEVALAEYISSRNPSIVNLAGKISIKQFGALVSLASAFLTCDTGPMHIAAALRTDMVVLSGAADPDRTGPISPEATVLFSSHLECAPCRQKTCARGDKRCMEDITVNDVILAINGKLYKNAGKIRLQIQPHAEQNM